MTVLQLTIRIADWAFTPLLILAVLLTEPILWIMFSAVALLLFVNSFKKWYQDPDVIVSESEGG